MIVSRRKTALAVFIMIFAGFSARLPAASTVTIRDDSPDLGSTTLVEENTIWDVNPRIYPGNDPQLWHLSVYDPTMYCLKFNTGDYRIGMIMFHDLNTYIGAKKRIISAKVKLYVTDAGNYSGNALREVMAYPTLEAWYPEKCSGLNRHRAGGEEFSKWSYYVPWNGGSVVQNPFNSEPADTITPDLTVYDIAGYHDGTPLKSVAYRDGDPGDMNMSADQTAVFDVTNVVKLWYNGTLDNNGLALLIVNEETYVKFATTNNDDITIRPRLVIEYEDLPPVSAFPESITVTANAANRDPADSTITVFNNHDIETAIVTVSENLDFLNTSTASLTIPAGTSKTFTIDWFALGANAGDNNSGLITLSSNLSATDVNITVSMIVNDGIESEIVVPGTMSIAEGGSTSFDITLGAEPNPDQFATVDVGISGYDTISPALTGPSSKTFLVANWNVPMTVSVTAPEETDIGNKDVTLTLLSSAPSLNAQVNVTVQDNDSVNIVAVPDTTVLHEDDESGVALVIDLSKTGASGDLTVTSTGFLMLDMSATYNASTATQNLTVTVDGVTSQTVYVYYIDDGDSTDETGVPVTIEDPGPLGVLNSPRTVVFDVVDDNIVDYSIINTTDASWKPTDGLAVLGDGSNNAVVDITLTNPPSGTETVQVLASAYLEVSANGTDFFDSVNVTFNSFTWDIAQPVTVRAKTGGAGSMEEVRITGLSSGVSDVLIQVTLIGTFSVSGSISLGMGDLNDITLVVATLYDKNTDEPVIGVTLVNPDIYGNYTFEGVINGAYYVSFTSQYFNLYRTGGTTPSVTLPFIVPDQLTPQSLTLDSESKPADTGNSGCVLSGNRVNRSLAFWIPWIFLAFLSRWVYSLLRTESRKKTVGHSDKGAKCEKPPIHSSEAGLMVFDEIITRTGKVFSLSAFKCLIRKAVMKIGIALSLVFLISSLPVHGKLHLIPLPDFVSENGQSFALDAATVISIPPSSPTREHETAALLQDRIRMLTGLVLTIEEESSASRRIELALDLNTPSLGAEGYELTVTNETLKVSANESAGLFYGCQTLAQLINGTAIEGVSITDQPDFPLRGIYIERIPDRRRTLDSTKRLIELMSEVKMNLLVIMPGAEGFTFPTYSNTGDNEAAFTVEDMRELDEWGRLHFVQVTMEINCQAHTEWFQSYFPDNMDANFWYDDIATQTLIRNLFTDANSVFVYTNFLHAGQDEVFGKSASEYAAHINMVRDQLTASDPNKTMLAWHNYSDYPTDYVDQLTNTDTIIIQWEYNEWPHQDRIDKVGEIIDKGFGAMGAPAIGCYEDNTGPYFVHYPGTSMQNVRRWVMWIDPRANGLLNCNWYPTPNDDLLFHVVYSGDLFWNQSRSDPQIPGYNDADDNFARAFGGTVFGETDYVYANIWETMGDYSWDRNTNSITDPGSANTALNTMILPNKNRPLLDRGKVIMDHLQYAAERLISDGASGNQPPEARFSTTVSGNIVNVDGAASRDWDGSIISWIWDFGDGATGSGVTTSHTYFTSGIYVVRLLVEDNAGARGQDCEPVTVEAGPLVEVTVDTSPAGRRIIVDGVEYVAPVSFNWPADSSHTLTAIDPQPGVSGTRFVFESWSSGGASSKTFVTPSSPVTENPIFKTQYQFCWTTTPNTGGTVSPEDSSWHDAGVTVSIQATPALGYEFATFSGDLSGNINPQELTMSSPKSVIADFALGLDSDGDGMPDSWEATHGVDDPDADPDSDKLTNLQEFLHGTDPNNPDTDGDGLPDGVDSAPLTADAPSPKSTTRTGCTAGLETTVSPHPLMIIIVWALLFALRAETRIRKRSCS